jgi:hypothetical protein
MNTLAIAVFAQLVSVPDRAVVAEEYRSKIVVDVSAMHSATVAEARRAMFERKYQALVKAMNAFAEKYNDSKGNTWPVKEVEAVRKAFRDLEKLEPGFESARR